MTGNNIKRFLDEDERTVAWLAKKLGRTYKSVHALCSREDLDSIPLQTLLEVAKILKVDIKELYENGESEKDS